MKKQGLSVLALAAVLAGGGLAQAQPAFSPYFGAGAGQSEFDVGGGDFATGVDDDSDTAWRVFVGGRAFDLFGLELGYIDFGEATGNLGESASATGVDLVAVGTIPLFEQAGHGFDVLVKGGGYWWDADVDGIGGDLRDSDDFDWTAGAGVQYTFRSGTALGGLGVRAEWQRYNDVFGSVDTDVWMGSVFWQF